MKIMCHARTTSIRHSIFVSSEQPMPTNNRRSNSIDDDRIVKWNQNEWAKLFDAGQLPIVIIWHRRAISHKLCFIKFKLHLARPIDRQLCNSSCSFASASGHRLVFMIGLYSWNTIRMHLPKADSSIPSNIGQMVNRLTKNVAHFHFHSRDLLLQHWRPSVTSALSTTPIRVHARERWRIRNNHVLHHSPMLWYILHFPNEPNRNRKEWNGMLRQRNTLAAL